MKSDEKVLKLEIPNHVKAVEDALKMLNSRGGEVSDSVVRFEAVFDRLRPLLSDFDTRTTAVSIWDSIQKQLSDAAAQLRRYQMDANSDAPDRLEELSDNLLRFMPLVGSYGQLDQIRNALNQVTEAANTATTNIAGYNGSVATRFADFEREGVEKLTALNQILIDGRKLSEIAASKVFQGEFAVRAQNEKGAAPNWTICTWIAAILTVALLLSVFIAQLFGYIVSGSTAYGLLGTQTLMTLTFGLVAKWCSKRARRHLDEEAHYHRLSVNMQTLRPLIATLEKPDQDKVIVSVALGMLSEPSRSEANVEYEPSAVLDAFKGLLTK